MIEWNYSSAVPSERVAKLLAPSSIGTIANQIAADMGITCCHFQICDDNADFGRVVYCIKVSEDLFDLFHNSPYGYRGSYYRSPGEGMDANVAFIGAISSQLLAQSKAGVSQVETERVRESLTSLSAKAWLAENGLGLCPKCEGEWGNPSDNLPEILNGRWEHGESQSLRHGRKAPRLTKIRVFGAFVDDRNNEFVPCRKRHRARDIHLWGWS